MAVELGNSRWKLPAELIALSEGDRWPQVLDEWELDYIEHLEPGEESETCLCHHHPIREVCHISNYENENTAIVGNCCVKKFEGDTAFKGTHKIFDALKRIRDDHQASANKKLIQYAFDKNIFTEDEYDFYLDVWRKRNLTERQMNWKECLNRKILAALTRSRQQERAQPAPAAAAPTVADALAALRAHPTALANPILVDHAFQNRRILEKDYDFYKSLFAKKVRNPSERQQAWINDINRRMLG